MLSKNRPHPQIPDHEVMRKIGGGAYGEVWLARGVTGALRAVKVVWREDFEDERSFDREFQGILKFEPISRDHPGLVNILHVGRSQVGAEFYYYVMELGDDIRSGQDINPIEYEPRTLRADHKQPQWHRWETDECIDVGLRLAEALGHMHEKGLTHRDIKPANIIFVNGRAKLADIGLVAARGQRTFVGTEGFVPPEGPGSEEADVYSLGKVLYEIATGKDRLDFPELPEDLPEGSERKRWLELNKIVCEVCEPRVSKRTITRANELADALRRLQQGQRRRLRRKSVWMTVGVLTAFFATLAGFALKDSELAKKTTSAAEQLTAPAVGTYWIQSQPPGAEVEDAFGNFIGYTPTQHLEGKVGETLQFTVRQNRYLPSRIKGKLDKKSVSEPQVFYAELKNFTPPEIGIPWRDQNASDYLPQGDQHVSKQWVRKHVWQKFIDADKKNEGIYEYVKTRQNGQSTEIVVTNEDGMERFCKWLTEGGIEGGFLSKDHECIAAEEKDFNIGEFSESAAKKDLKPFRVIARRIPYGSICVESDTPGAEVFIQNQSRGHIHGQLIIPEVKPGTADLVIVSEGYRPTSVSVNVDELKETRINISLEKNQGVVFSKPWENGIKMKFVPLGEDLMVSIWETRLRDYKQFIKDGGRSIYIGPDFSQGSDHPVVNVSRQEAIDFCEWLTKREQKEERIATSHQYRLPTDEEWSLMVGLQEKKGVSPAAKDAQKARVFPWGNAWPPPDRTGNFADESEEYDLDEGRVIPNYQDGFSYTAPVGSFPPNALGIYDLSGNVQEWVSDDYTKIGNTVLGILRGGGWNTFQEQNLYSGTRNAVPAKVTDSIYGFRVVLSKIPQK